MTRSILCDTWDRLCPSSGLPRPLVLALALLLATQIWAGLILRGLYADGSYYAARLWLDRGFVVIEPSRMASQVLMQAPAVLAMRLGVTDPHLVALLFSLSINLMPSLLAIAAVLVAGQTASPGALLALSVFLTGSMSAAFASIADGPCAAGLCCLLFVLVAEAPLSPRRLGLILLLSVACLRLHEAMAFLGPILVIACLARARRARGGTLGILVIAALCVSLGSIQGLQDSLHPRLAGNRDSFLQDVMGLRWLWTPAGLNMPAVAGLVALALLPLGALPERRAAQLRAMVLALFIALALAAWIIPAAPASAFAARGNACFIAAALFCWFLMTAQTSHLRPFPPFTAFVAVPLTLTLVVGNIRADLDWMRYRAVLRLDLEHAQGLILFPTSPITAGDAALSRCAWPWTSPLMSLWFAPGQTVHALMLNPDGSAWQPFDPRILAGALPLSTSAALTLALKP